MNFLLCRHELVLTHLKPHARADNDDEGNSLPVLYTMEDIHSKMQHVLTTLLNCYLGASNVRPENHSGFGAPGSENVDINLYFVRRRPFGNSANPTKQRKFTLFKFDNSQLAISKSSYLQEQQVVNRDRRKREYLDPFWFIKTCGLPWDIHATES